MITEILTPALARERLHNLANVAALEAGEPAYRAIDRNSLVSLSRNCRRLADRVGQCSSTATLAAAYAVIETSIDIIAQLIRETFTDTTGTEPCS